MHVATGSCRSSADCVTYDARKGQEKGKAVFEGLRRQNQVLQVADFKVRIGRGEWIRTTDLLVPNQAL